MKVASTIGRYPEAIELEYYRQILKLYLPVFQTVKTNIIPQIDAINKKGQEELRVDGFGDDITNLINSTKFTTDTLISDTQIEQLSFDFSGRVNEFDKKQFTRQSKQVLGISLQTLDRWLPAMTENWVQQNVSLIKTVPERYYNDIERVIRLGVEQGESTTKIKKQILSLSDDLVPKSATKKARYNALRIARDQIGKLNGNISKARQQDAGIEDFEWNTQDDGAVRAKHRLFDNKIYSWAQGAPGGIFPGQEILCRCWAAPVFDV